MDETRRKVLRAIATGAATWVGAGFAGGVIGGFSGPIGERIFNTIYREKDIGEVEKEALGVLLGERDEVPSIYAGEGNILGSTVGLEGISVYLDYAASQFSSYVAKALNPIRNVVHDNSNDAFIYDRRRNSIFLGGPSANRVTSQLLGYKEAEVCQGDKKIPMAVVDMNNKRTRWGQVYGESGFGIFNGRLELAARYSSRTGKEVKRPVYKMLDKLTGELLAPAIVNGFLMNEWLTIARLRDGNAYNVVIGGMHGYSTEAFCRNITRSIEQLQRAVGNLQQYQVIVPVMLSHGKDLVGRYYTSGDIDWPNAKNHEIVV
ncbi:MAG: hypothetical protein MN733_34125 [Nitrososphaera sp.]|nr:hypothetical protein [Nitrososphaera sp.]